MCGNPFKSDTPSYTPPKIEKVAPAPQAVTQNDNTAANERAASEAEKQRKRRGYNSTRVAEDRTVLSDTAQGGSRQTLG